MGYQIFLRYGAPHAQLQRRGAPLSTILVFFIFKNRLDRLINHAELRKFAKFYKNQIETRENIGPQSYPGGWVGGGGGQRLPTVKRSNREGAFRSLLSVCSVMMCVIPAS